MSLSANEAAADARLIAMQCLKAQLHSADQLENVNILKDITSKKKAAVDDMLKTALNGQVEAFRLGLAELEDAHEKLERLKISRNKIRESLRDVPTLEEVLTPLKEERSRHSQYVAAKENMRHIFTVPESLEKAHNWIMQGNFLHAHQCLSDLEMSRDDLLLEMHKTPKTTTVDRKMLESYFEGVRKLSDDLGKQIWVVFRRVLNTVRKEPKVIVTALRIVEREEKNDKYYAERTDGFVPPGRPKNWKSKALKVMEESVLERIEGNQALNRDDNKMWIVVNLEMLRKMLIEDLKVVRTLCVPVFPPAYDIVKTFTRIYHQGVSHRLQELISFGVEGNEIVSILQWIINAYPEILVELGITQSEVGPVLDEQSVKNLQNRYLTTLQTNVKDWLNKSLTTSVNEWMRPNASKPDIYAGGDRNHFNTGFPALVFDMVQQNVDVADTVSGEVMVGALKICMEEILQLIPAYRQNMVAYKTKYLEDRSQIPFFTHTMIANVNDCVRIVEMASQLKEKYIKSQLTPSEITALLDRLTKAFYHLRNDAANILLEETFVDLDPHLSDVFSRRWFDGSSPAMETILVTLNDYFADYRHLTDKNYEYVAMVCLNTTAQKYIMNMLQKKMPYKNGEERIHAAERALREGRQLEDFFASEVPNLSPSIHPCHVMASLAEVLKVEDPEFVSLELHSLVAKYPDVTVDILIALLTIRGDISKSDARAKAQEALANLNRDEVGRPGGAVPNSILSQVVLPAGFLAQFL